MKLSYTFRYADYVALVRGKRTVRWDKYRPYVFWGMILWLFALSSYFFMIQTTGLRDAIGPLIFGATVGVLLIEFVILPFNLRKYYAITRLDGKNIELTLSQTEITVSQPGAITQVEWATFIRYSQVPTHAFLWLNKMQAIVIPFDAFASEQEKVLFLNFIESKVRRS